MYFVVIVTLYALLTPTALGSNLFEGCMSFEDECPKECSCLMNSDARIITIVCEKHDLTELPHFSPTCRGMSDFRYKVQLNGNSIKHLNITWSVDACERVIALDVSNNEIETIDEDLFKKLPSLHELNLHGNRLKNLPFTEYNVPLIRMQRMESITLSGNPWDCRCGSYYILQWMILIQRYITDKEELKCANGDEIKMQAVSQREFCKKELNAVKDPDLDVTMAAKLNRDDSGLPAYAIVMICVVVYIVVVVVSAFFVLIRKRLRIRPRKQQQDERSRGYEMEEKEGSEKEQEMYNGGQKY